MKPDTSKPPRPFTGYHAAAIIISFFAVVIAVNFTMAHYAISTFGGTVVDNSYVASQKFNGWLEEARREKEMGWKVAQPEREGDRLRVTIADALGQPLTGARVAMRAEHPLGRAPERDLAFAELSPGSYRSEQPLPAGRWKMRARILYGKHELNLAFEVD
tara:strand:- start:38 stop:517 length:480 start_codon:yes stop_codon:yes gene_type:complete